MKKVSVNLKKISLYILIFIVSILVIAALYSSRHKFTEFNTIKYVRINIERATNLEELIDKYSSNRTETKFVAEIKKMNNIESFDYIAGDKTIIIPIIENQ